MIAWYRRIEIERIEQLALVAIVPKHHGPPPHFTPYRRNHCSRQLASDFLQQNRPTADVAGPPGFAQATPSRADVTGSYLIANAKWSDLSGIESVRSG